MPNPGWKTNLPSRCHMCARTLLLLGRLATCCFLAVLLAGCGSKITKENFGKIKEGMTIDEVEKILGSGTHQSSAGVDAVGGGQAIAVGGGKTQTYTWESDKKKITIYFQEGKVKGQPQQTGL